MFQKYYIINRIANYMNNVILFDTNKKGKNEEKKLFPVSSKCTLFNCVINN